MNVYIEKYHSKKIKCGVFTLFLLILLVLKLISLHQCMDCKSKFINLTTLKKHIHEKHEGKTNMIRHTKQDRQNSDYYKSDDHKANDLFSKKK